MVKKVVDSPAPSAFGQSVTFTATVLGSGAGAGSPGVCAGSVPLIEGRCYAASDVSSADVVAVNASHTASFSTASLSVGDHTVVGCYSGATSFNSSNGSVKHTVNKRDTVTTVVDSPAPSAFGQSVTFTATVRSEERGVGSEGAG